MTTPVDPLHDTDAPLVATVCNIPYAGTSRKPSATTATASSQRRRQGDSSALLGDQSQITSDIGPSGTTISGGSREDGDGSDENEQNDGEAATTSESQSSLRLTLDEEEVGRRKRIYLRERLKLLDRLFRDVDMLIYLELGALYYMDCSLLRFLIRVFVQLIFFTPKTGTLPSSIPRHPFVGAVFFSNLWILLRHALATHPSAKPMPDSRGYLQGGIFIDFVGVKAPVSRYALVAVDLLVMACQVTMIGVVLEKAVIGKELMRKVRGGGGGEGGEGGGGEGGDGEEDGVVVQDGDVIFEIRERRRTPRSESRFGYGSSSSTSGGGLENGQTHDSEERGVLNEGARINRLRRLEAVRRSEGNTAAAAADDDDDDVDGDDSRQSIHPQPSSAPREISLRDMLASAPTPEEQARVEHERSPLIFSSTSPSSTHNHHHQPAHGSMNGNTRTTAKPSSSSQASSSSISSLSSSPSSSSSSSPSPSPSSPLQSPNSPPPPYANPTLHPLDPLTCATASIMDFFVFPTLRRQWQYSARSSLLMMPPELGVPRPRPRWGQPRITVTSGDGGEGNAANGAGNAGGGGSPPSAFQGLGLGRLSAWAGIDAGGAGVGSGGGGGGGNVGGIGR